jgi:hypothetical protein
MSFRERGDDQAWRSPMAQQPAAPETWRNSMSQPVAPPPSASYDGAAYVADAKRGVAGLRTGYRRLTAAFWTLRLGAIAAAAMVAVLTAAGATAWVVATFGALAAALETVLTATNAQEKAVVRGLLADSMAVELRTFSLRIAPYGGNDALTVLHGRIEGLRSAASQRRFALEQAPA